MSYEKQNFLDGKILYAKELNAMSQALYDLANTPALAFDGGYMDEQGYLHLTFAGVDIDGFEPVYVGGGGGGGGGAIYTYIISLKNALDARVITVSEGQSAELKFVYSSVDEEGYDDGAGVGTITMDGVKILTFSAKQGENTVDITKYLTPGEHTVNVRVENSEGSSRSVTYTVTLVSLSMSTTLSELSTYTGEAKFYYTPVGVGTKIIHFIMDGEELTTTEVTASGRSQTYVIPTQTHGAHIFEAYAEMTVDNEVITSNVIRLGMLWVESGNVTPAIVTTFDVAKAKQGEALGIKYLAYDPTSESSAITLTVLNPDGTVYSSKDLVVDRSLQTWTVNDYPIGSVTFSLSIRNVSVNKVVEVEDSGIVFEQITDSLVFNFDAAGRSNSEDNPAVWTDGTISATFDNVAFAGADGWLTDAEGSPMLRLLPGSEMYLPFNLFDVDRRESGITIEVEMATSNVRDYDSVVMSCLSGGRGFKIASQFAQLNSEQSEISMQFKEDQRVRVSFVVNPKNLMRLIFVFVNGIMCGAIQYPDDDDFSQNPPVGITIGAESSGIDIYRIAMYTKGLTRHEVLSNYVADRATLGERIDAYYRNDVLDVSEDVVITKLPATLPYMIISSVELPQAKKNPKPCSITYVDPANGSKSFTAEGATIDVQGTSSSGYKKKNFLISLLDGLTYTATGTAADKYALSDKSIPVNVFCLKADVASSDNANNVELVKLYNETCPYRHPAMEEDPRVRYGIEGYPIVVFWHNTATGETTFWGKYNFNNDKSTPEVFGFSTGYECWEIKNNTSNRVLFKTSDYSSGWEDDFEAVYPSKHKDVTKLKALTDWIASTDRDAVATESAKTARLEKFKNDFENYFVKDAMLYYYLFTETFLMVDNRAKNFFPTYDPNIRRWYPFPYDMDTALGINNEGKLVFDYDLEDTDTVGNSDVYNAQGSVLWNNVRDAFADELAEMFVTLRNTSNANGETPYGYSYILKQFTDHQKAWPEAVWNEDAYEKYLRPLFDENDASYLTMLQGDKASQRDWWMYNGFGYRDSKYKAGDASTTFITLRCYAMADITVTPYSHIWPRIKYGSYTVTERGKRNVPTTLVNPNDNLNDTETYIYSADRLADIGDLSPLQVGYADFTAARKLQRLKLGDGASTYRNTNLTELYVGNNDLLIELDVQHCVNLTQTVDLSACDSLETVKARGSAVTGFTLPVGGHVRTLELPGTVTNFTIRDQKMFESVTFEGYSALTTLRIENTSNIDIEQIINSAPNLNRIRLIGIEWESASESALNAAMTKLKNSIGMDASGANTDKAVVSGRLYVNSISAELLEDIQANFPEIVVVINGVASYIIRYLDIDGTVLYKDVIAEGEDAIDPVALGYIETPTREGTDDAGYLFSSWGSLPTNVRQNYSVVAQYVTAWAVRFYNEGVLVNIQYVQDGLNAADPIEAGYIDAPTKAFTAQYAYNFNGWDKTFTNITGATSINAVFVSVLRTYTVRFYNGNTLLQTLTDVPYGSSVTYTGNQPVKEGEYEFVGFKPNGTNITGDTDCYAEFRYTGLISVDLVEGSLSGAYRNETVTKIGEYAFYDFDTITSVEFPAATSIGECAFQECGNLTNIDAPAVTIINGSAFLGCAKLASIDFPLVTSIGSYAFRNCSSLTSVDFPLATTVDTYAFNGCNSLKSANFPVVTTITSYTFQDCRRLTDINFPLATKISSSSFNGCYDLSIADFPLVTSIGSYAFQKCYSLTALILRSETMCTLSNTNAFTNCYHILGTTNSTYNPNGAKDGYIYVPRALVDSYKSATNWSTYADQIRAIEDYPDICGGES